MAKVGKLKEKVVRLKKKLEAGKEMAADKARVVRKQIKRAQRRSRNLVKMEARAKKQGAKAAEAKKEEGAAPPASA